MEKPEKLGTFKATSTDGYTVEVSNRGAVYQDEIGEVAVGYSWLGKPMIGISLHPGTLRARGLDEPRVELITSRTMRALQFLGYYVEAS